MEMIQSLSLVYKIALIGLIYMGFVKTILPTLMELISELLPTKALIGLLAVLGALVYGAYISWVVAGVCFLIDLF